MKFAEHFKTLLGKLNRALGIFSIAAKYLPASAKITLYNALKLPHMDYCSIVWSNSLRKQDLSKLQRIQNRAMRIALGCHPRTHIVDILDTLKWMSIKQRFHYDLIILLWKIMNNRTPPTLGNFFTPVTEIHTYNTRSSSQGNFH